MNNEKQILILGASFQNKGAQSMLFSTISELSIRFPNSTFFFSTECLYENKDDYSFIPVNTRYEKKYHISAKTMINSIFKRNNTNDLNHREIRTVMKNIDFVTDVSGYALGNKWPEWKNRYYLDMIDFVKSYGKRIYLMPQSFGPFDYKENANKIKKRIKKTLSYPKVVFAREIESKQMLEDHFGLTNVKYSPDLVLQTYDLRLNTIFRKNPEISFPVIKSEKSVCIIPNIQAFKRGETDKLLELYKGIIDQLVEKGYALYCISHSCEDIPICEKICEKNVCLINKSISPIEFSFFVKQFRFIIASRYHSVIHAYKEGVPCIVLGWAVKYRELAELLGQGEYVFSITDGELNQKKIFDSIDDIDIRWLEAKKIIENKVSTIQKNSCFNLIEDIEKGEQ